MSDKFLAVVKLKTGEEVIAKVEIASELDVLSLDCPAMVGHSSFTRKPGISIIKIEPWIKTGRERTYIVEMSNIIIHYFTTLDNTLKSMYNNSVRVQRKGLAILKDILKTLTSIFNIRYVTHFFCHLWFWFL